MKFMDEHSSLEDTKASYLFGNLTFSLRGSGVLRKEQHSWNISVTKEASEGSSGIIAQLFRLYLRSPLGKPMGPLEIPYPIGFLIPHWKSNPPRNPMGYRNSNGYQGLCVPLEFPYPIGIPSTLWITTLVHWKSNGCFIHLLWTDRGMSIVKLI